MPKSNAFMLSGGAMKAITEQSFPDGIFRQTDASAADINTLYNEVAWLRRAVDIIAQAISSMPRTLHKGKDKSKLPSKDDPIVNEDVLELDLNDNLDAFAGDFVLHGAAYGRLVENPYGYAKRLVRYVPTSITPQYSKDVGLAGFRRTVDGVEYSYTRDQVMYCWATNRKEEVGNHAGAVSAAQRAARVLLNTSRYYESYYANGAVNPTIISVSGDATDADRERIHSWYKRMLTGIRQAFKISVTSGEIKATSIGSSPKDLAAKELTDLQREDICAAIGVPKSILFSDAATNATASNDSLMLYELTVVPLAKRLFAALNKLLHKAGYHLEMHPEQLEVYQRSEVEKATAMVVLLNAGVMTTEEVRGYLGLGEDAPSTTSNAPAKAMQQEEAKAEEERLAAQDALKADIRRLATMARDRFKNGKLSKVKTFHSAAISPTRLDALKERLMACADVTAIDRVIGTALLTEPEWVEYG